MSAGNSRQVRVTADHLALGTDSTQAASHEDEATRQGDDGNDRVRDPFARHWLHRQQFITEKQAAACSSPLIRSPSGLDGLRLYLGQTESARVIAPCSGCCNGVDVTK